MYYFSELYGKRVVTEEGYNVGKLTDVVFLQEDSPKVTRLAVKNGQANSLYIPLSALKKINNHVTISRTFETTPLAPNETSVAQTLLDRQIIDLVGNKIVRVNDVLIQDKPFFYVSGIDIGVRGILRRLGILPLFLVFLRTFDLKFPSVFLSWGDIENLELTGGVVKLKKKEEKLAKLRSEDLADYLEKNTIRNARKFLKSIEEKRAAEIIGDLNLNFQAALFQDFYPETAAKFLSIIDPDEAVDIIYALPVKRREQVMSLLPLQTKEELEYLMSFTTTPVGKLMTSQFLTVSSNQTVRDVIFKIKKSTVDFSFLPSIFVLNDENQLVGVFSLHELLLQSPDTPVFRFMVQNPTVVHLTTPIEIVVNKLLKYRLNCLPVVAKNKKILGIITTDDVSDFIMSQLGWG